MARSIVHILTMEAQQMEAEKRCELTHNFGPEPKQRRIETGVWNETLACQSDITDEAKQLGAQDSFQSCR